MPELVHPSQLDPRLQDLQRPAHTGFTGGLCRAVAERWGVDPLIVRLAVVALAFAGGAGVVVYLWGCLLTPRTGGQPPILRWLPAFGRWPLRTQAIVVGVSSLIVLLTLARQTGVAWGPVIVVAAIAWGVARKRQAADNVVPVDAPSPTPGSDSAPVAGESVEQWRARLAAHAGTPLPTVDLYAPEATVTQPPPLTSPPAPRTSWWGAALVMALTGMAAAVPLVLGLSQTLLWVGVLGGGTAALSLLVWSALARHHRLPGALLVLALCGAAGFATLAMAQSGAMSQAEAAPGTHKFVGQVAELDLTSLPLDDATTVTIDATASVVTVQLPQLPETLTLNSDTIHVERPSYRDATTAEDFTLIIDGNVSVVELEVTQ